MSKLEPGEIPDDIPRTEATLDEAFELGEVHGYDEGYHAALTEAAEEMRLIFGMAKTPVRELTRDELVTYRDHPLSYSDDLILVAEWLSDRACGSSSEASE